MIPAPSRVGGYADEGKRAPYDHSYPVRVYSQGVRLLPITPTRDERPHVLAAWIGDLIGALR